MLNHKFLLAASFCLFFGAPYAFSQKELPGESVNIVKEFDARLLESNKIGVSPTLPVLDTTTKLQDYYVPQRPLAVKYDAPKLRPIGMKSGKKDEIYRGFAKLGGGVPTALWAEAGYALNVKDKFDGKIWFRHHNQSADKALENQKFFLNDGLVTGNYYINDKLAVEGKIGYSFDRVHFYGYNHDSITALENRVRQDYKILDIGGRLYNKERTDADLNFSIAPKFYLMNDYYANRETGFDLALSATKWFAEKHPLRFIIRTDFTTFDDTVKQNLNNIYLQPSFTFHSDILKLKIGGNFASNRDVFSVFPDCELGLRVFGDGFQIFAGVTGDLRKNTYRTMSEYNPFIQIRGSKLRNTRLDSYYGGLKGDFGWLEYSGQVGYNKASNLALFQTLYTTEGITRFQAVYDTVKMVNAQVSVKIKMLKSLALTGTLSENITMETSREKKPWGLPKLEGNFGALYTLLDGKATLKGNCFIADGIWYNNSEGIAKQSKILFDLGFGGSYNFTKNFGAFLDVNNLLNNRRARWADYPLVGTNFMAGITARF
ncbi:MAG: hypothetical protein WCR52_10865 [Bacteroidota bacterium]